MLVALVINVCRLSLVTALLACPFPALSGETEAAARNVDPGGMIMTHGQRNYLGWLAFLTQMFDWTNGCIAVTNAEMDEIWGMVPNNTAIVIHP